MRGKTCPNLTSLIVLPVLIVFYVSRHCTDCLYQEYSLNMLVPNSITAALVCHTGDLIQSNQSRMVMTQISGIRWCEQQLKTHSVSTGEALVLLCATTMGLIINHSPGKHTSSHCGRKSRTGRWKEFQWRSLLTCHGVGLCWMDVRGQDLLQGFLIRNPETRSKSINLKKASD